MPTAIDIFAKLYDAPRAVRTRLMTIGIPQVIPIAGGLGIKLVDVDDAHAISTMPYVRRSRNHVGSIYLGALLVQAEATMASVVIGLCRPPAYRVLVKRSEADFHARASKSVRAICRPTGEERAQIEACRGLAVGAKGDAWTTVTIETAREKTPVATMRFLLSIKRAR
jgi:hypothetical protein